MTVREVEKKGEREGRGKERKGEWGKEGGETTVSRVNFKALNH